MQFCRLDPTAIGRRSAGWVTVALALATIAIGASVASACGSRDAAAGASTEPAATVAPEAMLGDRIVEPPRPQGIVAELVGAADLDTLNIFLERAITSCMQGLGFQYEPQLAMPVDDGPTVGFGISFTDQIDESVTTDLSDITDADGSPNDPIIQALDDAGRREWFAGYDQCDAAAGEELIDRQDEVMAMLPPDLAEQLMSIPTLEHPALSDAIEAWSTCVAGSGRSSEHPWLLVQDLVSDFESLDPADEVARSEFQQMEVRVAEKAKACDLEFLRPELYRVIESLESQTRRVTGLESIYTLENGA